MKDFTFRATCRLCDGTVTTVLDLGSTPLANELVTREFVESGQKQDVFPLQVCVCDECGHVQLSGVVSPERLFTKNYPYRSGASKVFRDHLANYAEEVIERLGMPKFVVEIGSNDGTFLKQFVFKSDVLGVEPDKSCCDMASSEAVPCIERFFTSELAREIVAHRSVGPPCQPKADLVVANHVFAHIDNLRDVVEGVKILLADDGVFVFEVGYLGDVLTNGLFDVIYHEHLSYHHLRPLVGFFERLGMTLFDAEHVDTQGGSIRCFVKLGKHDEKPRMLDTHAVERFSSAIAVVPSLIAMREEIGALRDSCTSFLLQLKETGSRIVGFGAPAKCCTLLHALGFGRNVLDFIIDENPVKHGLFTPSAPDGPGHIEIRPVEAIAEAKPDYVLVLAWNFAEDIIRRYPGYRYIVPLPKLRFVEP